MRGIAAGERPVSQANTKEYNEHFEEVFEAEKLAREQRFGKWVFDPVQKRVVRPEEMPDRRALDAPVLAGRFYENLRMPDGRSVESRRQYNNYLRETGTTNASDYGLGEKGIKEGSTWDKAAKDRVDMQTSGGSQADRRERREIIGRALYEAEKRRR